MYLYGASGHCKVIIDIIIAAKEFEIKGILDDDPKLDQINGFPILHASKLSILKEESFIISIGNNLIRKKIASLIQSKFITAIHPSAILSCSSFIGEGTVIMPNVVVNSDAVIGKHCIINSGAVVEHDCYLDNFVHISPNAALAGGVVVKEGAHIGIGASVIQGITIGKWAVIGAGAVVIRDVSDNAIIVGNPGRIL